MIPDDALLTFEFPPAFRPALTENMSTAVKPLLASNILRWKYLDY